MRNRLETFSKRTMGIPGMLYSSVQCSPIITRAPGQGQLWPRNPMLYSALGERDDRRVGVVMTKITVAERDRFEIETPMLVVSMFDEDEFDESLVRLDQA